MGITQTFVFICAFNFAACTQAIKVAGSQEPSTHPSFPSFIEKHGRTYTVGTKEYDMRRSLFEDRLQHVTHHNANPYRRWTAGVNHLSDRTEAELSQLRGLRVMATSRKSAGQVAAHRSGQFLSQIRSNVVVDEKSWAHLKSVQQDINQQACGSCWAIATSMMLTANSEIANKNRTFSAQELVDCTPNPHNCGGSGGCDGATVELGMNWVMEQGLDTNQGTPYQGVNQNCKKTGVISAAAAAVASDAFSAKLLGNEHYSHQLDAMIAVGFHPAKSQLSPGAQLGLLGWERLPENEYEPLIRAIAERGPAAVSVGADGWNSYSGGIFDSCGPDAVIDHAVTLIGYGTDQTTGEKFWHIKNSWGNSWGEGGNIRLFRQEGNVHCGTDSQPKVGTGCDDGPSSVKVCGMCGILYDAVVPHF